MMSNQRQADLQELAAQCEADRRAHAAQCEADRRAHAAQCEADRKERREDIASLSKQISRLAFWVPIEMLCALAAVVAITEWLRG